MFTFMKLNVDNLYDGKVSLSSWNKRTLNSNKKKYKIIKLTGENIYIETNAEYYNMVMI